MSEIPGSAGSWPVAGLVLLDEPDPTTPDEVAASRRPVDISDPAALLLTCANCGAPMDERKCKLVCRCGYFLSCSDYY